MEEEAEEKCSQGKTFAVCTYSLLVLQRPGLTLYVPKLHNPQKSNVSDNDKPWRKKRPVHTDKVVCDVVVGENPQTKVIALKSGASI